MNDAAFLRAMADQLWHNENRERMKRIAEKLSDIRGYSSCEICEELFPDDELDEDHQCETCAEERGFWNTADGG